MKFETSFSNINKGDLVKPSKLTFSMLKKNRKTEQVKSSQLFDTDGLFADREAVASFAETQLIVDPNDMP